MKNKKIVRRLDCDENFDPDNLFIEMLRKVHETRENTTYLPLKARALLASQLAGDQEEARVLVDVIIHQWNLI